MIETVMNRWGTEMNFETIKRVLIIGAGAMGESIAQQFAQAGMDVLLADIEKSALDRSTRQISSNLAQLEKFGLLSEDPAAIQLRITSQLLEDMSGLSGFTENVDFIMEVVPEKIALKKCLFSFMDKCPKEIILASNTSTLSITEIAEEMQSPERVVGIHFFYPAHIVPLVEIHGGEQTSEDAIRFAKELMLRVGKQPIVIRKVMPGFIVNRMQAAFNREVVYMLEQGVATPEELDMAAKACFGFRLACLGPLEIHDLNGLDVVLNSWRQTRPSLCNDTNPSASVAEKVANGELGAKTGKGWYEYKGKTREEILAESNAKLLQQLSLFQSHQKSESDG